MPWVVDTCLLIDVAEADVSFGVASAQLIHDRKADGLVICPVTYVELAPVFNGDQSLQNEFLYGLGITWPEAWLQADTQEGYQAWSRYVTARRIAKILKRPIADILIGAFSSRFDGILTRNESDFRTVFPKLTIINP